MRIIHSRFRIIRVNGLFFSHYLALLSNIVSLFADISSHITLFSFLITVGSCFATLPRKLGRGRSRLRLP